MPYTREVTQVFKNLAKTTIKARLKPQCLVVELTTRKQKTFITVL